MSGAGADNSGAWAGAWLDALAFAGGLAVAWWARWQTADLVWSLWLSSLVVGYTLIVWTLTAGAREFAVNALRGPAVDLAPQKIGAAGLIGVGLLFGLAFFTVHFGGFHFVHSVFLNLFFPIGGGDDAVRQFPALATYLEVFRRYWIFLPIAFLAERSAFRIRPSVSSPPAAGPGATSPGLRASSGDMMAPYRNVIRMHLLIFFFAGTHVLGLENFAVYAVVYAVYFFPWRLLRRVPRVVSA